MFELAISYTIFDMATSKLNMKNKRLNLNSFSNQNGKQITFVSCFCGRVLAYSFLFFLTRSTKNAMYNKNKLNSRHMNFVNKIIIINITNKKAKVSKVIDIAQALPYF